MTAPLVELMDAVSSGLTRQDLAARVAPLIASATATDACLLFVRDDLDLVAGLDEGEGGPGADRLDPAPVDVAQLDAARFEAAGLDAGVVEPAGRWLVLRGATPPFDRKVGEVRIRLGEALSSAVLEEWDPGGAAYATTFSVLMASAPAGVVGMLSVCTRDPRHFADEDVRLLTSIGGLVASATHAGHLRRRLAARERAHERFTEQAIAAQEAERRRLAADIHDGITQRLCSLRFHLDAAADALTSEPDFAGEQLVVARTLARLTLDEARAAVNDLRPPVLDDLGLADSLASLARTTAGIDVIVDVDDCALPEHVEIAFYRIAQEALQNAVKHASASTVRLELRRTVDTVTLVVADDGRGWDASGVSLSGNGRNRPGEQGGYGLRSMTERADLIGGRLSVVSRVGVGTTVTARVSLA